MIQGIPSQPIDFVGNPFEACAPEPPSPLLIGPDDNVIFQFLSSHCPDAEQFIGSPDFTDWSRVGTWDVKENDACMRTSQDGAYIAYDSFNPTVGSLYEITIVVTSIIGTVRLTVGGFSMDITSEGSHTATFTATATDKVILTIVGANTRVCLYSALLYAGNEAIVVSFVDPELNVLFQVDYTTNPEYFTLSDDHVTVNIPMVNAELEADQCFKVFVSDQCDPETTLCSQTIKVLGDCGSTMKMRVCLDHDQPGMGFVAGRFELRTAFQVIRPRFGYKVEEEELSNGYINRAYAKRNRAWEFIVPDVFAGSSTHDFLSGLAIFDHFYIGTTEYSVDAEEYQPAYAESKSFTGAVQLTIRPKQELFERVQCEPVGEGCNPINDPICNVPNVTLTGEYADDGTYRIAVQLLNMFGFITSELIVSVDGAPEAPIPFDTAPDTVELGPYTEGQIISILVVNATDAECSYTFPEITVGPNPNFSTGGLNDGVNDIELLPAGLLVGGDFDAYGATPAYRFTKLGLDGSLDSAFNTNMGDGLDDSVRRFVQDASGRSVLAGAFLTIDGNASKYLSRVNTDGTPDLTLSIGTGFNSTFVDDVAVLPSGTIVPVGPFTTYNGGGAPRIIGLLEDGTVDSAFVVGTGGNSAFERIIYDPFTDTLLIATRFASDYNGSQVRWGTATIFRINTDGSFNSVVATHVDGVDPQFNGIIRGIEVLPTGKIFVTGEFDKYDGVDVGYCAMLNTDGSLDTAFMTGTGTGFNDWTTSAKYQNNGKILVGIYTPATTTFNGVNVKGCARLNTNGTRDASFNNGGGFNGTTTAMAYGGNIAYIGGSFTQLNGVDRKRVARLPFP